MPPRVGKHPGGLAPVDPRPCTGRKKSPVAVLFCPDTAVRATQVRVWCVGRWYMAGTFEATRAHLGLETPQTCLIPMALWDRVQQVLCYAA